jgi:hypothetical protein
VTPDHLSEETFRREHEAIHARYDNALRRWYDHAERRGEYRDFLRDPDEDEA